MSRLVDICMRNGMTQEGFRELTQREFAQAAHDGDSLERIRPILEGLSIMLSREYAITSMDLAISREEMNRKNGAFPEKKKNVLTAVEGAWADFYRASDKMPCDHPPTVGISLLAVAAGTYELSVVRALL